MKKFVFTLTIGLSMLSMVGVINIHAQSPSISSPTEAPVPTEENKETKLLDNQIKKFKDKIATKVAEISRNNKQVISGVIQTIDDSGITISTGSKTIKSVVDSELTTYVNPESTKKLDYKSLKKGDYIVLSGVMLNNEFSSETIFLQNQYEFLTGQIKNVEKKGYFIDVVTLDQRTISVDIEKTTVQKIIDPTSLSVKGAGFADYKVGDRIQCVIKKIAEGEERSSGVRTIIIPMEIGN